MRTTSQRLRSLWTAVNTLLRSRWWLSRPSLRMWNTRGEMKEKASGRRESRKRRGCVRPGRRGKAGSVYPDPGDQKLSARVRLSSPPLACYADTSHTAPTSLSMIFSWLVRYVVPCSSFRTLSTRRSHPSPLSPQINNILFGPLAFPLVDTDRPP